MSVTYTVGTPSITNTLPGASTGPATGTLTIPITEELTAAQLAGVERPVVILLKCTRYEHGTANYTYEYKGEYLNATGAYAGYDATNHAFKYSWRNFFDVNTNAFPPVTTNKDYDYTTFITVLVFNPTNHANVVVFKKPSNIPDPYPVLIDSFNPWRS